MALEDDVREMARVPLLHEIQPEALKLLAFSAETRILRKGDVLFRRGDESDAGYFIVSGSFSIQAESGSGVPLQTILAPALVGEMALIVSTDRPATVIAREPSTVLKIPRTLFRRVLKEYPDSALRVRRDLERRLSAFTAGLQSRLDA